MNPIGVSGRVLEQDALTPFPDFTEKLLTRLFNHITINKMVICFTVTMSIGMLWFIQISEKVAVWLPCRHVQSKTARLYLCTLN